MCGVWATTPCARSRVASSPARTASSRARLKPATSGGTSSSGSRSCGSRFHRCASARPTSRFWSTRSWDPGTACRRRGCGCCPITIGRAPPPPARRARPPPRRFGTDGPPELVLGDDEPPVEDLESARRLFEQAYLRSLLARAGYRVGKAARLAGVTRQGLYRLLRRN